MKSTILAFLPGKLSVLVPVLTCVLVVYAGVYVDCDPEATFHWKTRSKARASVHWVWPADAARAVLRVVSGSATNEVALTQDVSSWTWSAPSSRVVSSLTLTFLDANGAELADKSLRANGISFAPMDVAEVATTDAAFTRVVGKSAILPIPANAGALEIDGADQGLAADPCPSWFSWSDIASGRIYSLDLANGDSATLRAIAGGLGFFVR